MSDTQIQEQQLAPDFTLPAIGSDDVVKDGQVQLTPLEITLLCFTSTQKMTPRVVLKKRALSVMPTMRCKNGELSCWA